MQSYQPYFIFNCGIKNDLNLTYWVFKTFNSFGYHFKSARIELMKCEYYAISSAFFLSA